eukprot:scaffold2392_cov105-Cylindrotheca_fusiformis.AAC.2
MQIGSRTSSFNQLRGDVDGEATNGQSGFSVAILVVAIVNPVAGFLWASARILLRWCNVEVVAAR